MYVYFLLSRACVHGIFVCSPRARLVALYEIWPRACIANNCLGLIFVQSVFVTRCVYVIVFRNEQDFCVRRGNYAERYYYYSGGIFRALKFQVNEAVVYLCYSNNFFTQDCRDRAWR